MKGDAVVLREYRAGDVEAMYELDVMCFDPVFRFTLRAMRRFAEAKGAVVVVAESDGELAGFVIVQVEKDGEERVGYVVTLDVAEQWRRRGVAVRLMEEVEARVLAAGGVGMALHVFMGNAGAIRFYERMGYEQVGAVKGFYGRGLDAWVYRKGVTISSGA